MDPIRAEGPDFHFSPLEKEGVSIIHVHIRACQGWYHLYLREKKRGVCILLSLSSRHSVIEKKMPPKKKGGKEEESKGPVLLGRPGNNVKYVSH